LSHPGANREALLYANKALDHRLQLIAAHTLAIRKNEFDSVNDAISRDEASRILLSRSHGGFQESPLERLSIINKAQKFQINSLKAHRWNRVESGP
jgi:hypothetical protein